MSRHITKAAYQQEIDAQLHDLHVRIELLKAKEDQLDAEDWQQYRAFMEDLRRNQDEIDEALRALDETSATAWHGLRDSIDTAINNLSMLVTEASQRFNVITPQHDVKEQYNDLDREGDAE